MKIARTVLFILISIGLIWLVVLLFSRAFSGGDTAEAPKALVTYANTDAVTSMYIDGPVVADQEYRGLRITVSRTETKAELINGFEKNVVAQEVFPSNSTAYATFLQALERAGFNTPVDTGITKDERGVCPARNRFIYTFDNGQEETKRMWTSSCGVGNFKGQHPVVRELFIKQIPRDALNTMVRGSGLRLN